MNPIVGFCDVPESMQTCPDGRPARKNLATTRLQALIAERDIICEEKDRDRYGRIVGICLASGEDLSSATVRQGMAWAFVRDSRDSVDQEAKAKADQLRAHAHGCQPAQAWRAKQWR